MRDRKIQRELEKRGIRSLDKYDTCGVKDTVSRDAVERWKREVVLEMRGKIKLMLGGNQN